MQKLISKIDEMLLKQERVIVAIDGCSGAGKTSLAQQLAEMYDCNVFHMDDFFLRSEQRTTERLAEPGGNVDYERFEEEVITPLQSGVCFSYRPYDCSAGSLKEPVRVDPKRLNILEGTYSLHPRYADIMDIKVFMNIDEIIQRDRIKKRNPDKYERFVHEWIPLEQLYFNTYVKVTDCGMTILPAISNK